MSNITFIRNASGSDCHEVYTGPSGFWVSYCNAPANAGFAVNHRPAITEVISTVSVWIVPGTYRD